MQPPLNFRDQRKFGDLWLVPDPALVLGKLGPEPLADDFDLDDFRRYCLVTIAA